MVAEPYWNTFLLFLFKIKTMFVSVMCSCPELPWKCRYIYSCLFLVFSQMWNCSAKKGRWELHIFPLLWLSIYLSHPKGSFFQTITLPVWENLKDNAVEFIINLVNPKEKHNSNIAVSLIIPTGYSQPSIRKAAAASTHKVFHPLSDRDLSSSC